MSTPPVHSKSQQSPKDDLAHQPEFVLLAIARNQSASPEYRKAAVEHLIEKGYAREAGHPEGAAPPAPVRRLAPRGDEEHARGESGRKHRHHRRGPQSRAFIMIPYFIH